MTEADEYLELVSLRHRCSMAYTHLSFVEHSKLPDVLGMWVCYQPKEIAKIRKQLKQQILLIRKRMDYLNNLLTDKQKEIIKKEDEYDSY